MKFLANIKQWIDNIDEERKSIADSKSKDELKKQSYEAFQIMEFDGRLYISHNGVPIVRVDDLKLEAPKILSQSREDYMEWKIRFKN